MPKASAARARSHTWVRTQRGALRSERNAPAASEAATEPTNGAKKGCPLESVDGPRTKVANVLSRKRKITGTTLMWKIAATWYLGRSARLMRFPYASRRKNAARATDGATIHPRPPRL